MITISPEQTVSEIAAQSPASLRVFETLGIDYCCGGKRTLSQACSQAGVGADSVVDQLRNAERTSPPPDQVWTEAPLHTLVAEIVNRHHSYVRREIPRLNTLLAKVENRHGAGHPEIPRIRQLFTALGDELTMHLMKEEQILFPYIERLEQSGVAPASCFGTVSHPIANMIAEHEDAGALLSQMRELSSGYRLPDDACMSFQALYQGLHEFERDLHQHIHLENNILFPRAIAREENR